jgi:glycosyltransferase involved in cell wall biosynthesis
MLLSIIIPTYNVEEYITNCLDSLLNQDVPTNMHEILVINDGSTDSGAEKALVYSEKHTHIKVVHQENQGPSAARNKGISLAKGKYVYFIDADDYIAENTLGLILETLESHKLDLLGLNAIETSRFDKKTSKNRVLLQAKDVNVTDGITYVAENKYLNTPWWYFVKLEFLKETRLLFPLDRLLEDANFTAKLLVATPRLGWLPLDFYRYYIRPNSTMRIKKLSHVKRLVVDYEKNVFDFNEQLKLLRQSDNHPKLEECIERIEERRDSFVFFLLVKGLRFGLAKEDLANVIKRFKGANSYPVNKIFHTGGNTFYYKMLLPIINNERLFFALLSIRRAFTSKG